jgi:hypothetical protein
MAVVKSHVQTPTALTVTNLGTLASATYAVSATINHATNDPIDVLIDVSVTTGTAPTGNKQIIVFAKASIDGTNFGSGPESSTTTTDEPDLHYVGSIPMNSATNHRKILSLASAFGGTLPLATKLVFKNDIGTALTAASVQVAEVWVTVV